MFIYELNDNSNCVKSVRIRCFFWSIHSRIRTAYGDLLCKFLCLVQIRENRDQKDSEHGHFSCSELVHYPKWSFLLRISRICSYLLKNSLRKTSVLVKWYIDQRKYRILCFTWKKLLLNNNHIASLLYFISQ